MSHKNDFNMLASLCKLGWNVITIDRHNVHNLADLIFNVHSSEQTVKALSTSTFL